MRRLVLTVVPLMLRGLRRLGAIGYVAAFNATVAG